MGAVGAQAAERAEPARDESIVTKKLPKHNGEFEYRVRASFWNHNRSAGQGICHLSSRRKIVTPPLFARKIERDGDQAWRRRVR